VRTVVGARETAPPVTVLDAGPEAKLSCGRVQSGRP
jgi:hypothetical protein